MRQVNGWPRWLRWGMVGLLLLWLLWPFVPQGEVLRANGLRLIGQTAFTGLWLACAVGLYAWLWRRSRDWVAGRAQAGFYYFGLYPMLCLLGGLLAALSISHQLDALYLAGFGHRQSQSFFVQAVLPDSTRSWGRRCVPVQVASADGYYGGYLCLNRLRQTAPIANPQPDDEWKISGDYSPYLIRVQQVEYVPRSAEALEQAGLHD